MRRISFICALCVFLLLSAGAATARNTATARNRGAGDGTLVVKNGTGAFKLQARGGVTGHFADGILTVKDFNSDDDVDAVVTGAEHTRSVTDQVTKYWGHDVRFRFIGGRFQISLAGTGVGLSAIGRGVFQVKGAGTDDDGSFSLNGASFQSITTALQTFPLQATATP